jgi:hypothetical protein
VIFLILFPAGVAILHKLLKRHLRHIFDMPEGFLRLTNNDPLPKCYDRATFAIMTIVVAVAVFLPSVILLISLPGGRTLPPPLAHVFRFHVVQGDAELVIQFITEVAAR